MSFKVSSVVHFRQPTLQHISQNENDVTRSGDIPLLGGILPESHYVWHAKGPCLEVRNMNTGTKVGAWTFGCILKDSNTRIVCVEEIQRPNGVIPLLAVAVDCTISGGLICILDVFASKVIRAIQVKDKITSLHVVDSGCEVLNLPGPLRNFDGIIAVGTKGGNVFLVDICRQICEEALRSVSVRDELCPCQLLLLTIKDIPRIEYYKEKSVREEDHLAVHLNVVLSSSTDHFTLKGPKGDDRIFVNREEVVTSALYYCSQLTSLLVGFNFGAFQLWDLTILKLVYTSPICEDHIPITHFALQEPTDDPRAFVYIWASYSNTELFHKGLPFAVMYSVCYESKIYHEGYGYLYQDFQSCSVRFQIELGPLDEHRTGSKARGGMCIALQPICRVPNNRDLPLSDITGDILALCAVSWTVWFSEMETQTYMLVFDLNQWYKEQMPNFTKWSDCSNYILKFGVTDLISTVRRKGKSLLDLQLSSKSLRQFTGAQRLEEHFCPNTLSFDVCGLGENDVVLLHNKGVQKALLNHLETTGPLCLIRPNDVYHQIVTLGLTPLFTEPASHSQASTDSQRELILNVALEHQLTGWLCKCAHEWANGSFSSAGCSLEFLMNWALQRAVLLKTHCDNYCAPLFDYSHTRLDNNTSNMLNSCLKQINNLSLFYTHVLNKLSSFITNLESVVEQQTGFKMVSVYFEVLQWLVNVGLLPECHPSTYPRIDHAGRVNAPYPVQELTEFYRKKRGELQMLTRETFISSDSLLFIDNLISNKCGAELLQKQWQDDGGSGLYPPPSLQSLLRTYLIDGADISDKHLLVIYLFLDLAMALDQGTYSPVITYLIKFPAVFKVSTSNIKITQAFWQLDHGDFTTAIEQLLDPLVQGNDLQPWHHAVAMRSLLLQDNYNLALLYMQVRKPPITDEKDILTAISLFVANNMLDEALYFKNRHRCNNDEELLMHLFNECNKNDTLHTLLYRCLSTDEEKTFFKYLRSVRSPSTQDLQVFYYLLRARFVEAFDIHQSSNRTSPECLGLQGQENATRADQIVKIFKTLLPDVNKNVVEVIRKERVNLWKKVERPTPLSVFVHNTNEQIRYKSTVIHAALSKAKCTFFESPVINKTREILTEETPFLRTPKASRMSSRHATPVITPKVIELNETGEELGPSPPKRLKLSPRASTSSPVRNISCSFHSKMLTPIVKRKTSLQKNDSVLSSSSFNICTPQSILKIKKLVTSGDLTDDIKGDGEVEERDYTATLAGSSRKSSLGLLPRKSLSRTPRRPHVQFDDGIPSSSRSDHSSKPVLNTTSLDNLSANKSTLSSKDLSLTTSSKNSSTSNTDEVFYSPNSSLNDSGSKDHSIIAEPNAEPNNANVEMPEVVKRGFVQEDGNDNYSVLQSPKARRSYKRSFGETASFGYSPRITRLSAKESKFDTDKESTTEDDELPNVDITEQDLDIIHANAAKIESSPIKQSPRLKKNKGRKSFKEKNMELSDIEISKQNLIITDSNTPKIESSPMKQSPRLQKIQGRKSLSKRNLELSEADVTKQDSDLTDANTAKIESSPAKQSPRLQKVKGRKSLSRQVLEHNFSKAVSSPSVPRSNLSVCSETSFSRTEKTVVSEKTHDTVEVTTKETMETTTNLCNTSNSFESSHHCSSRNSVHKESFSDISEYGDGSIVHNLSFSSPQLPDYLKLSDSLVEWIKSGTREVDQTPKSGKTQQKLSELLENPEVPSLQQPVAAREGNDSHTYQEPQKEDGKYECEPMEVYEDLSSGAEDIKEVLMESNSQIVYSEPTSVSQGSEFNELEQTIFERSDTLKDEMESYSDEDHSKKRPSITTSLGRFSYRRSDSFYIPPAETGFLGESSWAEISALSAESDSPQGGKAADSLPKQDEVIEIGSSSEEQDSSKGEDSDTSDSRSLQKSESEEDMLNTSYERNIHEERNSSKGSTATDDSSNDTDGSAVKEIVIEEEIIYDNEVEIAAASDHRCPVGNRQQETNDDSNELNVEKQEIEGDGNVESNELIEIVDIAPQQSTQNIDNDSGRSTSDICGSLSKMQEGISAPSTKETSEEVETEKVVDQDTSSPNESKDSKIEYASSQVASKDATIAVGNDDICPFKEQSEVEHPTNTSCVIDEDSDLKHSVTDTDGRSKVDQSTNTTIIMPEEETVKVSNDSFTQVNRPRERKVYHPKYGTMKIVADEQTTSSVSSDTIEDGTVKNEIIVKADVHTPGKRKPEESLSRRITRRSSALFSQTAESDILDMPDPEVSCSVSDYDIMDEDLDFTRLTPRRKAYVTDILDESYLGKTLDTDSAFTPDTAHSRRSRSMTPNRQSRSSRRSQIEVEALSQPSTSREIPKKSPSRFQRTRSASVDEVVASPRRSLRRTSTEEKLENETYKPKPKGRAPSVSHLPIITEDEKEASRPRSRSRSNSVKEYTTTRRLTRRQATLIKDIETLSSVTARDDSDVERALDIEVIDPIKLLDKEPFQGPPDPEEEKIYEPSSPSNSTASSFNKPAKRTSRSASVASDSSAPPTTPKKRTKPTSDTTDSPSQKISGVRTRSRKYSETSSLASEKSEQVTPPKRSKKNVKGESGSVESTSVSPITTRSRANSVSSVNSDTVNSSKRKPRNRRLISAKSELPEITEEKVIETGASGKASTSKRLPRKKSSS